MSHTTFLAVQPLNHLRQVDRNGPVSSDLPLVEGIYFSWDDTDAEVRLDLTSPPGQLCSLDGRIAGEPGWLTLNIALGNWRFAPGDVFGLVADVSGASCTPYLRSRESDGWSDTALPALDGGKVAPRTILQCFDAHDGAVGPESFHTLVLPLPRRSFSWTLRDLAIFTLPASAGLRPEPLSLSSFAI